MYGDTMGTSPAGGSWYTCIDQPPTFFGCCTSNPCNGVGCPASDLRAAGMGTGGGPDFSTNDGSYWPNVQCVHGQWWTCAEQTPSFQGCCISNPCNGVGCAMGNLFPAAFGTVSSTAPSSTSTKFTPATSNPMTSTSTTLTSSLSSIESTTSATSAVLVTTSTSRTHLPSATTQSAGPNVAAIAGGAAGGAFGGCLILMILAFVIWKYRRRRRKLAAGVGPGTDNLSNPQFGSKVPDPEIHVYNDGKDLHSNLTGPVDSSDVEAYYPGRPIFRVRKAIKHQGGSPELTSSPPAYLSPQRSPNRNTHEIDSNALYEVEGGQSFDVQMMNIEGGVNGGAVHGLGLDYIAELPHSPKPRDI